MNPNWGYVPNAFPNPWNNIVRPDVRGQLTFPAPPPVLPGAGPLPNNMGICPPAAVNLNIPPPPIYPNHMPLPMLPPRLPFATPVVPPPPSLSVPPPVLPPSVLAGNYSIHCPLGSSASHFQFSNTIPQSGVESGQPPVDRNSENNKNLKENSSYSKYNQIGYSTSDIKHSFRNDQEEKNSLKNPRYETDRKKISETRTQDDSKMCNREYNDCHKFSGSYYSRTSSKSFSDSKTRYQEKKWKESRDRVSSHHRNSRSPSRYSTSHRKRERSLSRDSKQRSRSYSHKSSDVKDYDKKSNSKYGLSGRDYASKRKNPSEIDDSNMENTVKIKEENSLMDYKDTHDKTVSSQEVFSSRGYLKECDDQDLNEKLKTSLVNNKDFNLKGSNPKNYSYRKFLDNKTDVKNVLANKYSGEPKSRRASHDSEKLDSRARSRSRERSHSRSRSRSRERSRSRNRSRSRERSCSRIRSRSRERSHSRGASRSKRGSPNTNRRIRRRSREREDTPDNQAALSIEPSKWIKSTPAENYYIKVEESFKEVVATDALKELHQKFKNELVDRAEKVRAGKPKYDPPVRKTKLRNHIPKELMSEEDSSTCSEESSSSEEEEDTSLEELEKKRQHPDRLHPELWFNDPKEMNDGPLCRCSAKARRAGIRHGIYVGEGHLPPCNPFSNNANTLHHYKIAVTPVTNFLTKSPTIIEHNGEKYVFEGFSMFSHKPLPKLPHCKVIRFNYEYSIIYVEEEMPSNFTVAGLELFNSFLLHEILELIDLDWKAHNDPDGCPRFHFMPRFAKISKDEGKELLSLSVVMEYLLKANEILIDENRLTEILNYSTKEWQDLADKVKGMIVTCPGMKPSSIRVDQLDREHIDSGSENKFPVIVHFGVRPPQLSYAGNPQYQKAWRNYVKFRHLLANKPKVRYADRHRLMQKETRLQEMRMENDLKRDVTVVISSKGFYRTGIMSDVVQHAMLLPVLVCHLRFHDSLNILEENTGYKFLDRFLLQLALTHPSYRENFGTNPDHARNSLTNCGLRQPQYGDRRIHYMNTRKRGINTLINIMSRFGSQQEATSNINHNERLEFLGDAVVEFLSSIHLFYMFPDLEEGGLATYRAAIVQNQHLAVLSKKLQLEKFMLYAHGSDLCHDLELRHAMANCFEALMGALFLDGGIEVADKVFSITLFPEQELQEVWKNYPLHPLQEQEPNGDRRWIESVPLLQKIHKFEEQIGIEFTHIRLLARALTHRSLGYNNLTLGSNQRLEFLGDTVLQLVASEYLYKFFPQHHEGHLSLLRSSLVNNRTQAVVCGDLGMMQFAIYPYFKVELKPKDKADLLEAFLGALYVDKDLGYCRKFCEVCFFPRLQDFIMNQDWNDPKSKLQQCCLTLRSMDGGEPDIPTYKVIECKGPTNTRVYNVAVYFQGNRLAVGTGHSIQQAEMDAASNALKKSKDLFPQLRHQKRAIERSLKQGHPRKKKHSR
ncbi:ribonuclease 3 [Caerostris darwini]|uniref:Ribonuclease 3 n=1 Tax=Caerostris darwini TaxID=1538125 RepID=A0AAV4NNH0_9ARAC|nr:ribonuclease 3 [Caerostris darwini]